MTAHVISASRRTDIPAFYMPWFMSQIEQGFFEVENPYNRHISRISAETDQVHSIVFWSKDFGRFLDDGYGRKLNGQGYRLFFNFTINSVHRILEPALPPLEVRLEQLERLSALFGPQCIQWRFDPICMVTQADGSEGDNLGQFPTIADHAATLGIHRCISSFVDLYRKVHRRTAGQTQLKFREPDFKQKLAIVRRLAAYLQEKQMTLHLCCEKTVLDALGPDSPVQTAACIPGQLLADLYGPDIALQPDPGQRRSAGCTCTLSKDIGTYRLQPCRHDCLYCYANP